MTLRPTGHNTADGKRRRAAIADAQAAALVGAADVREWLTTQRAAGRTLPDLSVAVQRSIPWVRSRLGARHAKRG